MAVVEVKDLKKIYPNGTEALRNLSFSVEKGESVIVLGHNGSGKSTLFRCLTGFELPTQGEVRIFNESIHKQNGKLLRTTRSRVGMVFQNFNLVQNLSVFQNVLFGRLGHTRFSFQAFGPLASDEMRERAMQCIERVGLSHLAKRRADQLSGGQKQRIAIARMLMQDPEVILADEPIASLDPKAGREVMDLLWEIIDERGLTVITVLHQLEIAKEYGDRVIALKEGEIMIDSSIKELDDDFLASIYDSKITGSYSSEKTNVPDLFAKHPIGGSNH